ncbi:MAG TPA: alpha/beta hydrolase [Nocardioides sp.]|nr:alpha/beta hydrolase [Nocardioides sp.]
MTTIETVAATTVESVAFESDGAMLAGHLYVPDVAAAVALPAVVVTGTWTSVKEQMADHYAAGLAAQGFVALSFDFAGFGVSGGEPREVESARRKASDIRHAVEFLAAHPTVEPERIAALAICASAMYAALAVTEGAQLHALTLVAPWIHDAELVRTVYGESGVKDRLEAGERATDRYDRTGVVEYVPAADSRDPHAAMPMEVDFYTNPRRGGIPGWPNRFAVMAWPEWLGLDGVGLAPHVTVPTLIVHSPDAAVPDGARRFYEGLGGPKEIVWTTGTQVDFYDQQPNVGLALDHATSHFSTYLGTTENGAAR